MAWNQQNGGGWKSGGGGGGGPWGQGGGGQGGGQPPDFEEMIRRGQDQMKQAMRGGGGGLPGIVWFLLIAAGLAALFFYQFTFTVKPDELGVVLRFGKYHDQAGPGLHLRYPYPIDEVLLPKVTRENSLEIGMRSVGTSRGGRPTTVVQDIPQESLMLTGDENIVDVDFVVFWRIKATGRDETTEQTGVAQYLFNLQHPEIAVKEVAESAMREVVGKSNIQPLLTGARQETQNAVRDLMQKTLDSYGAGIRITRVQLQKVDPPQKVIGAFRDVQAARADQERLQNEARAYANRIVPEARGAAERILQAAEGYRAQVVEEARGQAARFEQVLREYQKAPDVTRRRIYLETIEGVYRDTDKIVIDPSTSTGSGGVVPYLPLQELGRSGTNKGAQ